MPEVRFGSVAEIIPQSTQPSPHGHKRSLVHQISVSAYRSGGRALHYSDGEEADSIEIAQNGRSGPCLATLYVFPYRRPLKKLKTAEPRVS